MEEKVMCDTNIFINWFNGDKRTIDRLDKIGLNKIVVSVVTVMELIQGIDNKTQLQNLKKKIKNYAVIDFDKNVSELSLELIEAFKLSHNLQIPDAIIAATAVCHKIPLFTFRYSPKFGQELSKNKV